MSATDKRDDRYSASLVAAWVIGCLVIAWDSVPLPNIGFAQDLGIMLDAGWRFYQGQRPHADFHSPLGPVLGLLFGLPMRIAGPRYESLLLLPPALSALVAFWAWAMCRGALPVWTSAVASTALGAVAGGIYHPGFPPEVLSFATFYNRVGFALLSIVVLAVFLPRRHEAVGQCCFLNCSALVAIVILLFLKANFVVPACACLVVAVACQAWTRRDAMNAIAVASTVGLIFLWLIGFRVDMMMSDLLMAADARRYSIQNYFFPLRNLLSNADFLLIMAIFSAGCLRVDLPFYRQWKTFSAHMAIVWLPFLMGLTVTVTQSHGDGRGIATVVAGMAASLAWLYFEAGFVRVPFCKVELPMRMSEESGSFSHSLRIRVCNACLVAVGLLFLIPHAQSYAQWLAVSQAKQARQFEADPLKSLLVAPVANSWGAQFPAMTNEACVLLRQQCGKNDNCQYIDVSNLLNFACGLSSPAQSMLWWDMSTYTVHRHPSVESLRSTQNILLPKQPMLPEAVAAWLSLYGSELEQSYKLVAETPNFKLYKRKSQAVEEPATSR